MPRLDDLIARFDVDDPAFIADPYPVLNDLREATPIFRNPHTGQWTLTRFTDIAETLGIPVGAVGPTRQRCLDRLRRHPELRGFLKEASI